MRRIALVSLVFALFLAAPDARALNLGGEVMVIPVIGRFPGAGGTQWRTDVFLGNPYTPVVNVTLRYYPSGGTVQTRTLSLAPFSTTTLSDIVLNTFGFENSGGVLEISTTGGLSTNARARIFNSGNPAGQFGQSVPGIHKGYLNRQAYMYGLSGINGNRLNVGVANPNDTSEQIQFIVSDRNNTVLYSTSVTLGPHAYVQYGDIFNTLAIPAQDGVVVQFISASNLIYGFASEVRNDTGDAVFMFGLSPNL
jgi:hypothetical protein